MEDSEDPWDILSVFSESVLCLRSLPYSSSDEGGLGIRLRITQPSPAASSFCMILISSSLSSSEMLDISLAPSSCENVLESDRLPPLPLWKSSTCTILFLPSPPMPSSWFSLVGSYNHLTF